MTEVAKVPVRASPFGRSPPFPSLFVGRWDHPRVRGKMPHPAAVNRGTIPACGMSRPPTVYGLFRRCQRDSTRDQILAALRALADAASRIDWDVSIDSMTSRAHQHAAGARRDGHLQKEPSGGVHDEPADHAIGRSQGGLTTNTHLACEQGQKVMAMTVTAGHRRQHTVHPGPAQDQREPARWRPSPHPSRPVLADNAYTSKGNRRHLRSCGIKSVSRSRTTPQCWPPRSPGERVIQHDGDHDGAAHPPQWATLMPDGRVFAAGGGLRGGSCSTTHFDARIFMPAYLLNHDGISPVDHECPGGGGARREKSR